MERRTPDVFMAGYRGLDWSAELATKARAISLKGLCRKFRSDQHFVGNGFGYKADGE
jgi:hypothetical protein